MRRNLMNYTPITGRHFIRNRWYTLERRLYHSDFMNYTTITGRHFIRKTGYELKRSLMPLLARRAFDPSIAKSAKAAPTEVPIKLTKEKLCLLIAAHNEELVIAKTLTSAIAAGMDPTNIYVVDDNSDDNTSAIAKTILPVANVMRVQRSGKGLALTKGAHKFNLTKCYQWIHIADADGAFAPNYFHVFRTELNPKYAAATGYVRSLPGRRVSEYRVYEYTIGMEIQRRLQILFNVVPVIPGPTSCFRCDVFEKVNFDNKSLTEDFDVTMQLHRLKLGRIQFIPDAIAYTQDPRTIKDYTKQISRWNRGGLQSLVKYKIGRRLSLLDIYLSYTIFENLLFFASYFIWIPFLALSRHTGNILATAFVIDVFVTFMMTLYSASRTRRWDILGAFPQVYLIRWLSLGVFLKAFVEVIILRKYRNADNTWESSRYVVKAQ